MESEILLRDIFNAFPAPVFVVDEDVRIQEYNTAASELLATDRSTVIKTRAGEVLHCIHSDETPDGCGRAPFCKECIVRNSVTEAYDGKHIVRRRAKLQITRNNESISIYALVTASPFLFNGRTLSLLVIEDISELVELYRMIPICAVCGKVRDDKESWMKVESYFKNKWDLNFTHGLCPDCYRLEKEKAEEYFNPGK
jgi:PAS domain-containing protein